LLRGSSTAFPVKKDEKNVKVIAGFYIGEKSYLADVSKDVSSYAAEVESVFDSATRVLDADTYLSIDKENVNARLSFDERSYEAEEFFKSLVTADDQEGLPILLYLQAVFSIDEPVEIDDLDSESSVTLQIGQEVFNFLGVLEEWDS
jgi:hypothetical protein